MIFFFFFTNFKSKFSKYILLLNNTLIDPSLYKEDIDKKSFVSVNSKTLKPSKRVVQRLVEWTCNSWPSWLAFLPIGGSQGSHSSALGGESPLGRPSLKPFIIHKKNKHPMYHVLDLEVPEENMD